MLEAQGSPELIVRHIYFDDAGLANASHEPYTVVAGVVLHVDNQYTQVQKYLLDMADDLVGKDRPANFYFHATDIWHGDGFHPRDTWDLPRRMKLLTYLAEIPWKFQLPIIYSCVERKPYLPEIPADMPRKKIRRHRAAADEFCHKLAFLSCMGQTEKWMREMNPNEKIFAVVENHETHGEELRRIATYLGDARRRDEIAAKIKTGWPTLDHFVEDPLLMRKTGTSPLQLADACAFILSRALGERNHIEPFLEHIKPCLVSGFLKSFTRDSNPQPIYTKTQPHRTFET